MSIKEMDLSGSQKMVTKASFRGNPPEERKQFSEASCLMPISVGQAVHENEKFTAVVKLVNASFKTCTILVDDSVQRHTLAICSELDPDALYDDALALGQQWLLRNQIRYAELTIPYQILRWDDWLKHPDFEMQLERVRRFYSDNLQYRASIHQNVDDFLTRYLGRESSPFWDKQRSVRLCIDYLLEECAVMCLWTHGEYHFELYPSGRNQAMRATYEMLIKPQFPEHLRSVAVRFKKYTQITECQTVSTELDGAVV